MLALQLHKHGMARSPIGKSPDGWTRFCCIQIHISFLPNLAPETVAAVHALSSDGPECHGCKFYRNEAAPSKGSLGPPYGLLQVPATLRG